MSTPPSHLPASTVDRIDLSAFAPLRPAEQMLLRAFVDDDIARVGLRRPLVPSASISVRGAFVAHLARHGGAARRVQVVGAWIEGPLDLRDASVPEGLWFFRCVFDASPRFDGARVGGSLSFPGCLLPGLRAEDCTIAGDVALNAGCTVRLDVRLARATVGGDLNCGRLQLRSGERVDMQVPRRLIADGASVAGDALLTDGFESDGDVRLVGLRLVGDLRASSARLSGHVNGDGRRSDALNLDLARWPATWRWTAASRPPGGVRLKRARIDGDLDCTQAAFDAFGDMGWRGAVAFALDRARVGGTLVLARLKQPLSRATLADASVGALHDDDTSWGESLVLDGFAYRQLAAAAPASSGFRIDWLARQQPAHMGRDFRPQPWQQVIRAFQRMGLAGARATWRWPTKCSCAASDASVPTCRGLALAAEAGASRLRRVGGLWPPPLAPGVGAGGAVAGLRRVLLAGCRARCGRAGGVAGVRRCARWSLCAGRRRRRRLDAVRCAAAGVSRIQCVGLLAGTRAAVRRPAAAPPVDRGGRARCIDPVGHVGAFRRTARGGVGLGRLRLGAALPGRAADPKSRARLTPS